MTLLQKIRETYFNRRFILFVFCGGMGTLANMLISSVAALGINPTLAYVCGYFGSSFVTYSLNSKLTFNEKLSVKRYIKFVISYIPNFVILFTMVAVFINLLGWYHLLVYGMAAALGLPLTFLIVRIVAFAKKDASM